MVLNFMTLQAYYGQVLIVYPAHISVASWHDVSKETGCKDILYHSPNHNLYETTYSTHMCIS